MTRALLALALAACSKAAQPPPPPPPAVTALPAGEARRAEDACKAYVEKACGCAAAKTQCDLARALPDAIKLALDTAANADTPHDDALRALQSVRETAKSCIEQTAKLPALGCP